MKKLFVVLAVLALVGGSAFAQVSGTVTANVACSMSLTADDPATNGDFWLIQGGAAHNVELYLNIKGSNESIYSLTFTNTGSAAALTYGAITLSGLDDWAAGVWAPDDGPGGLAHGDCVIDNEWQISMPVSAGGSVTPGAYTVTLNATLSLTTI